MTRIIRSLAKCSRDLERENGSETKTTSLMALESGKIPISSLTPASMALQGWYSYGFFFFVPTNTFEPSTYRGQFSS